MVLVPELRCPTADEALAALIDADEVLTGMGVAYWLDGGTLLGAIREGDFCADDHDDIDLSCWSGHTDRIPGYMRQMQNRGFHLYHHWVGDPRAPGKAQEVSMSRDRVKIDLFFQERDEARGVAWHLIYRGDQGTPVVAPIHLLDSEVPLQRLAMLRGREFPVPVRAEDYLTHRYGDWRTPVHRSEWSSLAADRFKALKPGWEFWR